MDNPIRFPRHIAFPRAVGQRSPGRAAELVPADPWGSAPAIVHPALAAVTGLLVAFLCSGYLRAAPVGWEFNPPKAGRALLSGGWMAEYPLGDVNASPEFDFRLQLIYLNTRRQAGMFGSGWFCPQLESSVLPADKGHLIWTMPSGGQMVLEQNPERGSEFRSRDREWRAELLNGKHKLTNRDGWEFRYDNGQLIQVVSPTMRALEFDWDRRRLRGMQIRDMSSNQHRSILAVAYGKNKRLSALRIDGRAHRFAYVKDGIHERLSAWDPPVGETMKFAYQDDSGVLAMAAIGDVKDPERVELFKTRFVNWKERPGAAPEGESKLKKDPANYWLFADRS